MDDLINFRALIDLREELPETWRAVAEAKLSEEIEALHALVAALPYVEDASLPMPVLPPKGLPLPSDPDDRGRQSAATRRDVTAACVSGARSVEEIANQIWVPVSRVESALIDIAATPPKAETDDDVSGLNLRERLQVSLQCQLYLSRAVKTYLRSKRDKSARKQLRSALKAYG